eukprot:TRINITY_DN512_c0_g1_i12.p1 TRINITY_DN512_c0_g1~~TRINITY_DN512_c0_g1_i12.p1  ORF type:complete len:201 (-),score=48.80 TRINITY_DN512_c0_g1_i12:117-719(-)
MFPGVEIYGGDTRIPGLTKIVKHGDQFNLLHLDVQVISTPCHTTGHVLYLILAGNMLSNPILFSGDTLFIGGCGRFFEGTASEMNIALNHKISSLPLNTHIYCGHEYTVNNLLFAASVEPNNQAIREKLCWARQQRKDHQSTLPSTLQEEKEYNVFMRLDKEEIKQTLFRSQNLQPHQAITPTETMKALREMKDSWKSKL